MDEATQLREQITELRVRLSAIESAEARVANAAYVGKCYRYRNCYSLPQDESDYWWLYSRVISADDGGFQVFQFQTDKGGKIQIEPNDWASAVLGEEIPPEDFVMALSALHSVIKEHCAGQFSAAL